MLKGFIIEDEQLARTRLKKLLQGYTEQLSIIGEADRGETAIEAIEKQQPNLLFLDIQLPDMTGFEVLQQLTYQPLVIFTTAYEQYAIQAFDTHSIDYLVKPFRLERFKRAMEKLLKFSLTTQAKDYASLEHFVIPPKEQLPSFSFPIKLRDRILLIDYEDISHLKAEEKYIRVFTNKGKTYLSDGSLGKLEGTLPIYFVRVHRSYIVNQKYIKEARRFFKGKLILVLNDRKETAITTGETYSKKIRKLLGV